MTLNTLNTLNDLISSFEMLFKKVVLHTNDDEDEELINVLFLKIVLRV